VVEILYRRPSAIEPPALAIVAVAAVKWRTTIGRRPTSRTPEHAHRHSSRGFLANAYFASLGVSPPRAVDQRAR
jgi:hypothetical protein